MFLIMAATPRGNVGRRPGAKITTKGSGRQSAARDGHGKPAGKAKGRPEDGPRERRANVTRVASATPLKETARPSGEPCHAFRRSLFCSDARSVQCGRR
jgi:hypothetical protein